jgi:REP element-mobilizing transposase RayT
MISHFDRKRMRLPSWDYRNPGVYFVTICTFERRCLFEASTTHAALEQTWRAIGKYARGARGEDFVVMPNHGHGGIWLPGRRGADASTTAVGAQHVSEPEVDCTRSEDHDVIHNSEIQRAAPLRTGGWQRPVVAPGSLGAIVRAFKSASAKRVIALLRTPGGPVWQRGYHDRVIRDDRELDAVRRYILDNPAKWALDHDNPHNSK